MTVRAPVIPVRHGPSADRGSGPVRSRTPAALRSSATKDRIGRPGTARPIQALANRLLPKPDRGLLFTYEDRDGAGQGSFVVVRGCPLGTVQHCCEWHASVARPPRVSWVPGRAIGFTVTLGSGPSTLIAASWGKSPEGSLQSELLIANSCLGTGLAWRRLV